MYRQLVFTFSCSKEENGTKNPVSPSEIINIGQGGVAAGFGGLGTMLLKCGPTGWKGWAALVIGGAVGGSVVNAWDQLWPE